MQFSLTLALYRLELEFPWSPSLFTLLLLLGVSISRQKFAMSAASALGVYKQSHQHIHKIFSLTNFSFFYRAVIYSYFSYLPPL